MLNNMGAIAHDMSNWDKARQLYDRAEQLFERSETGHTERS